MLLSQFEAAFPRLMDQIYAGYTLHRAVAEYPIKLDYGSFNRWVMRDAGRRAIYEEAQEYRAEVWADRMIENADDGVGANGQVRDIERSKFVNDTYKFLMSRQSKKRYGDNKTIEVEHRISIAAALEQSRQRVIEAEVVDVTAVNVEPTYALPQSSEYDNDLDEDDYNED